MWTQKQGVAERFLQIAPISHAMDNEVNKTSAEAGLADLPGICRCHVNGPHVRHLTPSKHPATGRKLVRLFHFSICPPRGHLFLLTPIKKRGVSSPARRFLKFAEPGNAAGNVNFGEQ